ncbi:MAG TPA: hypothetical protein VMD75_02440 [Candidatus Binataceae bacterium]|jgi:hypothetical protein|nr:hypothetical protein [Candidatus Binataceae bacterium]
MLPGKIKPKRITVGIAIAALIVSAAPAAMAKKPVKVTGTSAGSFSTANFSYDGVEPGLTSIVNGNDTNGAFGGQTYTEYVATGEGCTAPDKTAGSLYRLVGAWSVTNYKNSVQLVAGSKDGSECISTSTGVFGGTSTYTIAGGSGKYFGATGTGTDNFEGVVLFPNVSPGGGLVGTIVNQYTESITP